MTPGEVYTFYALYTIQPTDPDPLVNTATVTGDSDGGQVSDEDSHSMDIEPKYVVPTGDIEVTKTLNDEDGTVKVGEAFSYTIRVENTGDTFIEAPVELLDTYNKDYLSIKYSKVASDDSADDGEVLWSDVTLGEGLESGQSLEIIADFGARKAGTSPETTNTAQVTATDENGTKLVNEDDADVTIKALEVIGPEPAPTPQPPVIQPPPSVMPAPITAPVSGTLPYTGATLYIYWILGGALILLGLGMILVHVLMWRRSLLRISK